MLLLDFSRSLVFLANTKIKILFIEPFNMLCINDFELGILDKQYHS